MDKIIPSFRKSLFSSSKDIIVDLTELSVDSLLDDGLLKDLPIVGLLVGVKNTAQSLHDRNLLKQTLNFIKQFNSGKIDEIKLNKYIEEFNSNNKKTQAELERVLIILNNIIELEKSSMLANLFKSYINEIITWDEFCEFSEIIRMMFIQDIEYFKKIYSGKVKDTCDLSLYPIDRLSSLGLVNTSPKRLNQIEPNSSYFREEKFVVMSKIGGKFYQATLL